LKEILDLKGLSGQEEQVLLQSMSGLSDKEIALRLKVSIDTVRTYWKRIRQKVGGQTRPEIIALLLRSDLASISLEAVAERTRSGASERGRVADEHLRLVTEALPVPIYVMDEEDRPVYANHAWKEFAGTSDGDLTSNEWIRGIHPDDRAEVLGRLAAAKADWSSIATHFRFVRRDSSLVWVNSAVVPILSDSQLVGFVFVILDVAEEIQNVDRFAILADMVQEGILALDQVKAEHGKNADYRVSYANHVATDFFGMSSEQIDHCDFGAIFDNNSQELITEAVGAMHDRKPVHITVNYRNKEMNLSIGPVDKGIVIAFTAL
jgi:PAS domain S-box-containing protein